MTDYRSLNSAVQAVTSACPHFTANLANASALLWEYLTTNQYNDLEVALPEYAPNCAHKSGWNTRGYHESGVVFGVRTYICVVMTETGYRNDCIYRTIRNLDNIMKDYDVWLKNQKNA